MNNPNDRYAIIPLPPGPPPPNALMIGGPLSQVMQCIPDTVARRDSIRTLQAARLDAAVITQAQKATRALQAAAFADSVDALIHRMDTLETKRAEARAAKAKADAAREQKQIADYLNTLPSPDEPEAVIYSPGGEMHAVSPSNTDDNEGDLPSELSRATPPPPGDYPLDDPAELNNAQPKNRAPVAVSLNFDDY